jgi:hypothetical protein
VIANVKEVYIFAIQLNESTNITGKAELLAFSKFVCNGDITEKFLFFKALPETTKGQNILDVVDSYFSSRDLSWKPCISICTDRALSMSGSLKGFIALAKQTNHEIVFTHGFLHREALISQLVIPGVQRYWMRRSEWSTTSRAGHCNQGCFQHCVLPRKVLTHNS